MGSEMCIRDRYFSGHDKVNNTVMLALIVNFICRFNKLTERHYEKSPWPEADYVASIVDGGKLSLIFHSS